MLTVCVTTHASLRYWERVATQQCTDQIIVDAVRRSRAITDKSDEWFAPLVRAKAIGNSGYYYDSDTNVVFVVEQPSKKYLRVVTCWTLDELLDEHEQIKSVLAEPVKPIRRPPRTDAEKAYKQQLVDRVIAINKQLGSSGKKSPERAALIDEKLEIEAQLRRL